MLEEDYKNYKNSLHVLNLQTLDERRKYLTYQFAETGIKNGTMTDLFQLRKKIHCMNTRKKEYYKVTKAHTKRFQNSPVLTMQKMLNEQKARKI